MKKFIQYFIVASIFVACNSKSDLDTKKDVILTDTSGMYKSNIMTDTGSVIQTTTLPNRNQNKAAVANRRTTNTNRTTATNNNRNGSTSNSGQTTTVTRNRGWRKAAQGAVIGGVGGAVTGAIISKNKGKGAIIGRVIGAAGGYIIGRSKDKKDGRN